MNHDCFRFHLFIFHLKAHFEFLQHWKRTNSMLWGGSMFALNTWTQRQVDTCSCPARQTPPFQRICWHLLGSKYPAIQWVKLKQFSLLHPRTKLPRMQNLSQDAIVVSDGLLDYNSVCRDLQGKLNDGSLLMVTVAGGAAPCTSTWALRSFFH